MIRSKNIRDGNNVKRGYPVTVSTAGQTARAAGAGFGQAGDECAQAGGDPCGAENPDIDILGNPRARRLSIVSFRLRAPQPGRFLHHNFVVAVLSDLFGIQARGGCSCAGPYGHRLLAIDQDRSHAFEHEISLGCEGIKPGWTRVNFNYFITDTVRDYLIDAVDLIARHGHRLLPLYNFDPATGLWRHRSPDALPALRLTDVHFAPDADGTPILTHARKRVTAGEHVLAAQLRDARDLLEALPDADADDDAPTGLAPQFEALRWFPLPTVCLTPIRSSQQSGEARPGL